MLVLEFFDKLLDYLSMALENTLANHALPCSWYSCLVTWTDFSLERSAAMYAPPSHVDRIGL